MGIARLCSARSPPHQSVRRRSWTDDRGGHPHPGSRYVRTRLPHRLRRKCESVHRYLPTQHRLGVRRGSIRRRIKGRAAPPPRAEGVRDAGTPLQIVDARPRSYISRQQDIMDGAVWRDPERIHDWVGELSKSDPVVVFCAYGFHVGCKTAIALREAGFDAKYMKGGHSAWKAIGGPIKLYT